MQQGPDWGDGAYEAFSDQLMPAAIRLAEVAAPQPGERAVDVGCGDGNATIWLARSGATVTAVEPSERLLALAARRCAEAGQPIAAHVGRGEALPLADDAADVITSNFAVIFSSDPHGVIREALRVLAPGGRFVYSAWRPDGGIAAAARLLRGTVVERTGGASAGAPEPPPWHAPHDWLVDLVPGGADAITVHDGILDFVADSGAEWMAQQAATHPAWLAARRALDDDDAWADLMDRCAEVLDAHSTVPEAMLVPSPYAIVEIRPQA